MLWKYKEDASYLFGGEDRPGTFVSMKYINDGEID
jgi:hypothetical protein